MNRHAFLTLSLCLFVGISFAQETKTTNASAASLTSKAAPPAENQGIYFKFKEDGSQYLRMGFWIQNWFRGIENNPGTAVNEHPEDWTFDVGIRRMRIQMYGQVSPRVLFNVQIGADNQSFATGGGTGTGTNGVGKKAPFFFHDAYGQFNIIQEKNLVTKKYNPFSLAIGSGLHQWNGVSRLSSNSSSRNLTADGPGFTTATVEASDQFARQLGVFAKGYAGKLAYRLSLNKPFLTSAAPVVGGAAVENNRGNIFALNGYFAWQFLEREDISTPFYGSSYFGKKKVFNIGGGFMHTPHGTLSQPRQGEFVSHDIDVFGLDVYYDVPVGNPAKEMSFTIYSVWYNYNFGPGYYRTSGVMSPGTADPNFKGEKALEGYGSNRMFLGTGNIWYTQAGFVVPKFSDKLHLQPYVIYTYKDLKALNEAGSYYTIGNNFLFDGHKAKISLEYNLRPLYNTTERKVFKHAGEILAAIQYAL